ncbi:hypothetical protein ATANTOWER_009365 [Ataeniobius toweri]|uniref:Uncharacterized protein n=1 Tax=Ataeniobius toweri TaxID=208326 RepID=A0ABU7C777_9TELE|nr:hypothetical protein [Ataeniobius toweri]
MLCEKDPKSWSQNLPLVEHALNSLPSCSTDLSPFYTWFMGSSHLCLPSRRKKPESLLTMLLLSAASGPGEEPEEPFSKRSVSSALQRHSIPLGRRFGSQPRTFH